MKKTTTMASLSSLFCSFFFFFFVIFLATMNSSSVGASEEFKVGGSVGWREPNRNESALYSHWAASNKFHVGDSLRFEYKNDSVLQVDKWAYYHCNTTHPISKFKNGNNVFNLHKPGPAYFISGNPDHCDNGQRLSVHVISLHPISPSPPSIANPPDQSDAAAAPSPYSSYSVPTSVPSESVPVALTLLFALFYLA